MDLENLPYLLHAARNLSVDLDSRGQQAEAALVNDLMEALEALQKGERSSETVLVERDAFKVMLETTLLFNFWIDNVGRLSLSVSGAREAPVFRFQLNPPGRRQQFLREEVIQALMDVREQLKTPQYG